MSLSSPPSDDPKAAGRLVLNRSASLFVVFFASLVLAGFPGVSRGTTTVTGGTVTFAWNPSAGAEGYCVVYAPYDSEPFEGPFTGKIDVGERTRVSFEIWQGAGFHVAVQAYNEVGTSQVSNVVSFVKPLVAPVNQPRLDIRANGSESHLVVPESAPVTLSLNLDQVGRDNAIPDIWIVADTTLGFYSFRGTDGWVEGIHRYEEMFPGRAANFEIPSLYLPVGDYTFYLAVDDDADRLPDGTWWEAVSVEVIAVESWWSRFLDVFPY